jgi:starch synthase
VNILFVAAECAPFVKVGGLGDVVGELPRALSALGESVRVILPHHGRVADGRFGVRPHRSFEMSWNASSVRVEVAYAEREGVGYYFIRGWPFFSAHETFVYHMDEGIDVGRFLFLAAAALQLVRLWDREEGWKPDIYHAHDWHMAMVPYLLTRMYYADPVLGGAPTLFSIHNMQYQGWGVGWHLQRAGLLPVAHGMLNAIGRTDNSLAIGLAFSTMLSTVSPRYAQEISGPEGGFGLDGLLSARQARLIGILNGIDTQRWNPETSQHVPQPFSADTLEGRVRNKLALQKELGLPQRSDVPVVGAVTRLAEQKGPDILVPAIRYMLAHSDTQFVLLGSGDPRYESEVWGIGVDFPDKAAIRLVFDEPLSERIYAGSDIFVMPSLFEPCGIGQMIAMRYGAVPVVRAVGGLADTVSPDVGFLFQDYHPGALGSSLGQALDLFRRDAAAWHDRQRRAMLNDFSWQSSAQKYRNLYEQTVEVRRYYL